MRNSEIVRKSGETDIRLTLNLDGNGKSEIQSGCGFLDHMLTLFSKHSGFDLTVSCVGDTQVDMETGKNAKIIARQASLCVMQTPTYNKQI